MVRCMTEGPTLWWTVCIAGGSMIRWTVCNAEGPIVVRLDCLHDRRSHGKMFDRTANVDALQWLVRVRVSIHHIIIIINGHDNDDLSPRPEVARSVLCTLTSHSWRGKWRLPSWQVILSICSYKLSLESPWQTVRVYLGPIANILVSS